MKTVTFNIPEISCDHCTSSIESALKDLTGIHSVTTSVEDRTATVVLTEEHITIASIIETIDEIGFSATEQSPIV